jgi:putative ABC transport system substrate-binding protein
MQAFEEGLRTRGLIHGSTVTLTHKTAGGQRDALMPLAAEVVALAPDVIVAVGGKAAVAAQKSTKDIPIVAVTGDMNSAGLVKNFSQPEGNVTGYSFFTLDLAAKRLELLLEVNPSLRRLKILAPASRHRTQVKMLAMLDESLKGKGIDVEVVGVADVDDLEAIIANIASSPEDSLVMLPSVEFDVRAREIGGLIAKHRVIAMLPWKEYVEAGGLMSYSPDIVAIWREASTYVDRILRGAKPSELPVTLSTLFELVVNLRSAQDLGLTVPTSILLRANRIIE